MGTNNPLKFQLTWVAMLEMRVYFGNVIWKYSPIISNFCSWLHHAYGPLSLPRFELKMCGECAILKADDVWSCSLEMRPSSKPRDDEQPSKLSRQFSYLYSVQSHFNVKISFKFFSKSLFRGNKIKNDDW